MRKDSNKPRGQFWLTEQCVSKFPVSPVVPASVLSPVSSKKSSPFRTFLIVWIINCALKSAFEFQFFFLERSPCVTFLCTWPSPVYSLLERFCLAAHPEHHLDCSRSGPIGCPMLRNFLPPVVVIFVCAPLFLGKYWIFEIICFYPYHNCFIMHIL